MSTNQVNYPTDSINIRFEPEYIREIADLLFNQESKFKEAIQMIKGTHTDIQLIWEGTTAEEFSKKALNLINSMEQIDEVMLTLCLDLFVASGIYKTKEELLTTISSQLPTEGVFLW